MKSGIKFGPPVNREVTSKDVKYAIERGFNKNVANGYASAYFGNLEGAPEAAKKADGEPIGGIVTPDDHTIVFKLTKSTGDGRGRGARPAAVDAGAARVREAAGPEEPVRPTATTSSPPART